MHIVRKDFSENDYIIMSMLYVCHFFLDNKRLRYEVEK